MKSKVRNRFWLGMVALVFVFSSGCGVEGINFTFDGFTGLSDVYTVPNGGQWLYSRFDSSLYLETSNITAPVAGRFLYPHLVQMVDPKTKVANSFSCNFIFQISTQGGINGGPTHTGSGMTFMMVPDNFTIGGTVDYMGLLTANSTDSNLHTFGVEFDTHMNPEFNDPNDNHIGIDLRTMNSTATFIPTFRLANDGYFPKVYIQVWMDYFQAPDSRMDLYIGEYGQGKPSVPFTTYVNLSFLNEYIYVGFSAAQSDSYVHEILAWSFSTDGPAPPILSYGPPESAPNPDGTASSPPPGPAPDGTASSRPGNMLRLIVGLFFGIVGAICILIMLYCWTKPPLFGPPVRFFLAHAAGKDYAGKIFAERLDRELKVTWRYRLNLITVFFDRRSLNYAEDFTEKIRRELNRTHVGVVIVTEEFFQKKWPMTELLSFVKRQTRVKILPLFYRLDSTEVRKRLRASAWDENWREMTRLDMDECRDAVLFLCDQQGVEYNARDRSHESRYIDEVLAAVAQISDDIRHRRRE